MTEPTDAELLALIEKHLGFKPRRDDTVIDPRTGRFHDVQRYRDLKADILAEWGTPAVAKWAPEEIADGERGIRWVTNEGIHGRPTDHDVREYLKQTPTAHGCHCDECKQFYTTPQPTQAQAGAVPLTDEQLAEMMRETWGCASIAPRHAMKPVAPDFYTACAWYEGGGESGWIALPGYSNETEHGVKHLILEAARKEGYKGTITGRLMELGWEIRPVYLAPQPTQAAPPAGREPLTEEQRSDIATAAAGFNWADDYVEAIDYVIDGVESLHGVKGDQQ